MKINRWLTQFLCLFSFASHFAFGQVPQITSISSVNGRVGTMLTISGSNFGTGTNCAVSFGGVYGSVQQSTTTSIQVLIPNGAANKPVMVTNTLSGLSAWSRTDFVPYFSPPKKSVTTEDYSAKTDLLTPGTARDIAIADIDGDGFNDILAVSKSASKLSVLRNATQPGSKLTVTNTYEYATGLSPSYLAVADLDGDGKSDVVVVNADGNTLSLFRNTSTTGTVSLAAPATLTTGTSPGRLAIGDLNLDGRPDIVVPNLVSNTISIFRNTGSKGTLAFASKTDFATSTTPTCAAVGDLDNDGLPDIAVTAFASGYMDVFRNLSTISTISLSGRTQYSTGSGPLGVTIADLDQDGKNDLAIVAETSNLLEIFRNVTATSGITLATRVSYATGTAPKVVTSGDADGDGKADLAICASTTGTCEINLFRNTSTTGAISVGSRISFYPTSGAKGLAMADIDGDFRPDMGVANETASTLSIFRSSETRPRIKSFYPVSGFPGNTMVITGSGFDTLPGKFQVQFGAVSTPVRAINDSIIQVVIPQGATKGNLQIVNQTYGSAGISDASYSPISGVGKVNLSTADFASRRDYAAGTQPNGVKVADMDNDGKPDMITCNYGSATVSIFRNTSTGTTLNYAAKFDIATNANPHYLSINDFDGDGKRDLAIVHYSGSRITVFKNTSTPGNLSFASGINLTTALYSYGIACADFDNDGRTDIAVGNYGNSTISLFKNISTLEQMAFVAHPVINSGSIMDLAASDFDKDGKVDLVATNFTNGLTVFRNITTTGNLSFSNAGTFLTGTTSYLIALADFDLDGKTDIAVTNNGEDSIAVVRNISTTGIINFQTRRRFKAFSSSRGIDAGDLNGDGYPDLTVIGLSTSTHSVFINTGNPGLINFYPKVDLSIGANPLGSAIADLNADNFPELISANEGSGTLSVYPMLASGPAITSIAPLSAKPGDTLTISGQGFSLAPDSNLVWFSGAFGKVVTVSLTQLKVIVPPHCQTGPILYTNLGSGFQHTSRLSFTPTYPVAGTNISGKNFIKGKRFKVASSPAFLSVADLDLDGKADFVFPLINTDSIAILKNTGIAGNIDFGLQKSYYTGKAPILSKLADLNGDGKPEILVSNSGTNFITLLRNTSTPGNISFAPKQDLSSDPDPGMIAIADLNGDGKPEIVCGSYETNSGFYYKNNSRRDSIAFSPKVYFKIGLSGRYVINGDFDGDGKQDLATTHFNGFGGPLAVIRNLSALETISLDATLGYSVQGQATAAVCQDFNSDNKPDIIVCNWGSSSFSILRNTGTPGSTSFATATHFPVANMPGRPNEVATGDLNADGKPDLIFTNTMYEFLQVKLNDSKGDTIRFKDGYVLTPGTNPTNAVVIDLNGDGYPDLASAIYDDSLISVMIGSTPVSNTIQNNQTVCMGARPALLTGNQPSECTGNGTFKWISSTSGPDAGFGPVTGKSDSVAYQPDYLTTDTWYRRIFTCSAQPDTSAAVKITMVNAPVIDSISGTKACSTNVVYSYSVPSQTGLNYAWSAYNGVIQSGQGTSQVNVKWNGNGLIMLILKNAGGCSDTAMANISIIYNPNAPVITTVNPMTGTYGDTILITGNNFTGTKSVKFGNNNASKIIVMSNQSLKAVLGFGGSGEVEVVNVFGKATKPGFVYITAGLNQLMENTGIEIYPNPANEILTLKTKEPMQVSLLTQDGRLILALPLEANENEIQLQGLSSGVYLLMLQSPKGIVTQRLVICKD